MSNHKILGLTASSPAFSLPDCMSAPLGSCSRSRLQALCPESESLGVELGTPFFKGSLREDYSRLGGSHLCSNYGPL